MSIVCVMVVLSAIITLTYKISVHTVGIWGLNGMMLPLNKITEGTLLFPTVTILLVAGAVMSSRLFLNAHTPREVLVGALVGFGVGFGGMILLF